MGATSSRAQSSLRCACRSRRERASLGSTAVGDANVGLVGADWWPVSRVQTTCTLPPPPAYVAAALPQVSRDAITISATANPKREIAGTGVRTDLYRRAQPPVVVWGPLDPTATARSGAFERHSGLVELENIRVVGRKADREMADPHRVRRMIRVRRQIPIHIRDEPESGA